MSAATCVVGLGRIGLPLAVFIAGRGGRVVGADIDRALVEQLNHGASPDYQEEDLAAQLARVVREGRFQATTDTPAAVKQASTVIVVVPLVTGQDGAPDYRHIDAATAEIALALRRGQLVIYETTLPVGDTRERFASALGRAASLAPGTDFHVAFSPERVYMGRIFEDLGRYPKVVGGIAPCCTAAATEFYAASLGAHPIVMASAEEAELVKLAETGYRDLNIAYANELALYAETVGADVTRVIEAANTQPFSRIHRPGLGVGGHCIPVYPRFLIERSRYARLSALAREVNDGMPQAEIRRLSDELHGLAGKRVLVLGLSFRENVKVTAFSVAFRVIADLEAEGATVFVNDPFFSSEELAKLGLRHAPASGHFDAVVLQAAHDPYQAGGLAELSCEVFLDGRNVMSPAGVRAQRYLGVGTPRVNVAS